MNEFHYYKYIYQIPYNFRIYFFIKENKITNQIEEIISWNEFNKERIYYSDMIPFSLPSNQNVYTQISEKDYKEIYEK